jgi:hypothetical protein
MSPLRLEEEKVYTNQQATINIMTGGKPRQPPTQTGALPIRQCGLIRALVPRVLAVVTIPRDHKQGGSMSFEVRGEEGRCCFDSLKINMSG